MAFQVVFWQSTKQICCNDPFPVDVILCLDPAKVAQRSCANGGTTNFPWTTISAQLLTSYVLSNDCWRGIIYHYSIRYDDAQIVGAALTASDILGILCSGCMTSFILSAVGNEPFFTQNEDGSLTFTSPHGCTFTFDPAGVSVLDTPSINLSLVGTDLSGDVNISADAGNQVSIVPDGLFVPEAPILDVVDSQSIDLSILPGGILAALSRISADPGNQVSVVADGLFVPEPFITGINNSTSVNLNVTLGTLTAGVIVSPDAGNQILDLPNGLFVPQGANLGVLDTDTVDLTFAAPNLSADVRIWTAAPDNLLSATPFGLYVPTTPDFIQSVAGTATVDLDVTATILTANVNQAAIQTDGWIPANESWTSFGGPPTITVPSDATLKYAVGDKVRLVQDAITKYFYIYSVSSATTIEVTAGDDFTLSANPITDPYFSHVLSPVGHPQRFSYTPTFNGFSVDPATPEVQWSLFGKMAHLAISTGEGTSDDTVFEVSLLVPMMTTVNPFSARGAGFSGTDNGTFAANIMATISSLDPTILQFFVNSGGAITWTAAGNKAASGTIDYPIT